MVLTGVATYVLRENLNLGRVSVLILRINYPFILGSAKDGVIEDFQGPDRGTHAVLALATSERSAAFFVRNSWGVEWGEQGYGWISEGYLEARCLAVISYSEENP